jgi:hypothetical protein
MKRKNPDSEDDWKIRFETLKASLRGGCIFECGGCPANIYVKNNSILPWWDCFTCASEFCNDCVGASSIYTIAPSDHKLASVNKINLTFVFEKGKGKVICLSCFELLDREVCRDCGTKEAIRIQREKGFDLLCETCLPVFVKEMVCILIQHDVPNDIIILVGSFLFCFEFLSY